MPISEQSLQHLWPFSRKIWLFILFLGVFLASCATYNLDTMPKYDFKEANERYVSISETKDYYQNLGKALGQILLLGAEPTEEERVSINKTVDKYIYWSAVANIHLFNGNYDKMDEAVKKTQDSLDELKTILVKIIQKNNL